jgi:osmotically-inducible protein OsmY
MLTMATPLLTQTRALAALRQSPIPALRKLAVEETDGAVVLLGSVASYYQKQLAQETVMPFVDGRELHNRVMVIRADRAVANSR